MGDGYRPIADGGEMIGPLYFLVDAIAAYVLGAMPKDKLVEEEAALYLVRVVHERWWVGRAAALGDEVLVQWRANRSGKMCGQWLRQGELAGANHRGAPALLQQGTVAERAVVILRSGIAARHHAVGRAPRPTSR